MPLNRKDTRRIMSSSSTSLPQIHVPNPSTAPSSKSQVVNSTKGPSAHRSLSSAFLPAVAGGARQSSPDIPGFFHGHTHSQAVATGQIGAPDVAPTQSANPTTLKASVLAALHQAKEGDPHATRFDGKNGFSDTRLRLFVKGALPCFNPTIMEAYGAGVRDLGISTVDPDVRTPHFVALAIICILLRLAHSFEFSVF
jgi:hypothetical protein